MFVSPLSIQVRVRRDAVQPAVPDRRLLPRQVPVQAGAGEKVVVRDHQLAHDVRHDDDDDAARHGQRRRQPARRQAVLDRRPGPELEHQSESVQLRIGKRAEGQGGEGEAELCGHRPPLGTGVDQDLRRLADQEGFCSSCFVRGLRESYVSLFCLCPFNSLWACN